jgi:hypothetical protein
MGSHGPCDIAGEVLIDRRGHMHDDTAVPIPFRVKMLGTSNHLRILPHNHLTGAPGLAFLRRRIGEP